MDNSLRPSDSSAPQPPWVGFQSLEDRPGQQAVRVDFMDYVVARDEEWKSRREGTWRPADEPSWEEVVPRAQREALRRQPQTAAIEVKAPDVLSTAIVTPEPAPETPTEIPQVVTYGDRAEHIVIRCPKRPIDLKHSWWTIDALDSLEVYDVHRLWFQVGFVLKSPVLLTEYGAGNRPRPGPIKFFHDVSAALARRLDGKPLSTFKNPEAQFGRFPIRGGDAEGYFTLRELSDMVMTQSDRSRAGGQSKSLRKAETSRTNLAMARAAKQSGDAERQERLRRYVAAGLTIRQIAEFEGVSYDAARMAIKRAKDH